MYLVVIAWLYVVLMMSVVEATGDNGSFFGAIVTFILYGLLPLSLVIYMMFAPQRRKNIREREALEEAQRQAQASGQPDAGGHPPAAAQAGRVAAVREEP